MTFFALYILSFATFLRGLHTLGQEGNITPGTLAAVVEMTGTAGLSAALRDR